jgi:DNA-directed RNA polymerase specialized sigma24 family protein
MRAASAELITIVGSRATLRVALFSRGRLSDLNGSRGEAVTEPPLSDEELARRAATGDPRAFARLHERHRPGLDDFAVRVVGDRRLAARVLKSASAEARATVCDGRARGSPKAWLYASAYRAALDALLAAPHAAVNAGGAGAADHALLDLHHRYGLGEDELAPSLGVPHRTLADRLARLQAELGAPEAFTEPPPPEPRSRSLPNWRPIVRRHALAAGVAVLAAATTGAVLAARGGGVGDPGGLRAVTHRVGQPGPNVVAVVWSREPNARGYSILWSREAGGRPDQTSELPGSATSARSPALAAGTWWFSLRTLGEGGEWSDGVELGPFVVRAPPVVRIETHPAKASRSRSATFRFSASESGAKLECALDGADFRPCESPRGYRRLKPGRHRLAVRATGVSLAPSEPVVYTWTIDTRAPRTRITRTPPDATRAASADFRFAASERRVRFQCKLDTSPWYRCRSPESFSHLTEQPHRFAVRARDRAGNVDRTPAIFAWLVDRTPPDTTIRGASRTGRTARFQLGATESQVSFRCSLDGAAFTGCSSPLVLSGLSGGRHTLRVLATDAAGNAETTPAQRSWTVDSSAPGTLLTGHPPSVTSSREATFSFSATEDGATFECSLDGRAFTPCPSPITYISLEPGDHVFRVRARDRAGNVDPTPVSWRWRVR